MRMSEAGPEWELVRSPVGQDFIDLANRALGTSFTEEDFKRDRLDPSLNKPNPTKMRGTK